MSGKSGFHPCTACNANIPQEDKHTLCAQCLGVQQATSALEREMSCSICAAFQPRVKEHRLVRQVLHPQWPDHWRLLEPHSPSSMTCPRTPCWTSPMRRPPLYSLPISAGEKGEAAQVLELLASPSSVAAPIAIPPSPRGAQGRWDEASQLVQEDTLSIAASGDGASFSSDMQLSFSTDGMRCSLPAGPLDASSRTTSIHLRPQKLPAFPDFMEEASRGSTPARPANNPQVDKHTLCVRCLALEREMSCSICAAFQPRMKEHRGAQGRWDEASQLVQEDTLSIAASGDGASFSSDMQLSFSTDGMRCSLPAGPLDARSRTMSIRLRPQKLPAFPDFMEEVGEASSASSVARPLAALGAPQPLLHDLSQDPLLDIPDAQAPLYSLPISAGEKGEAAQVLELLVSPSSVAASIAIPPSPRGAQGRWDEASQLVQEDTLSIAASGDGASFSSDMQLSFSTDGMRCSLPAGPLDARSRTMSIRLRPQKLPAFPDFMEEVRSSWDRSASGPTVLKQAAPLVSLEGAEKLGIFELKGNVRLLTVTLVP
ncbi:UNVERIFIED_CONTAM: hypothetical protein FKN15_043332 [Acipenser sinensis]